MDRVATAIPVLVGSGAAACTTVVHGMAVMATLRFVRRERAVGHVGTGFWIDLWIVATTVMIAFAAHLIEIALWAAIFVGLGEFDEWGLAFYHSAVNYTSLGYGDVLMSSTWKVLGPIETTVGLLMFGVSTALLFAVIQRMIYLRFPDLQR